jgi:arylsulfatase
MRRIFVVEASRNLALPIGGALWVPVFHPEQRLSPPGSEWTFSGEITRIPEICAPTLGNRGNLVTVEADLPENADGVLYALGGFSGGLSCYMKEGVLSYEYNLFEVRRTHVRSAGRIPAGKATIEVETRPATGKPGGPLDVTLRVDGKVVGQGQVPVSAPLAFTGNDCLDIGIDLGSPVSVDYFEKGHFPFAGRIREVRVRYVP